LEEVVDLKVGFFFTLKNEVAGFVICRVSFVLTSVYRMR